MGCAVSSEASLSQDRPVALLTLRGGDTAPVPRPSRREDLRVAKRRFNGAAFATVVQSSISPTHNFSSEDAALAPFDAGLQLVVGNCAEGFTPHQRHADADDDPSAPQKAAPSDDAAHGVFVCSATLPSDDSL